MGSDGPAAVPVPKHLSNNCEVTEETCISFVQQSSAAVQSEPTDGEPEVAVEAYSAPAPNKKRRRSRPPSKPQGTQRSEMKIDHEALIDPFELQWWT